MNKKIYLFIVIISLMFILNGCLGVKQPILNIVEIGDFVYALSDYSDLYYSVVGISEKGKIKEELTIPSEINGIPVTRIGISIENPSKIKNYFESENLKILYFSEILEIMRYGLFEKCPKLERIICLSKTDLNKNRDMVVQVNNIGRVDQYKIINNKEEYIYGYIYTNFLVENWHTYFYLPGNVVYFLNEKEDIYYIDFCENITSDNLPKDPKRDGYKFMGWYKEPECINEWDIKADVLPEIKKIGDIIEYEVINLYAKWEEIEY